MDLSLGIMLTHLKVAILNILTTIETMKDNCAHYQKH